MLCPGPIFLFSEIVNLIFVSSSTPSWAPAHLSSFATQVFTSYFHVTNLLISEYMHLRSVPAMEGVPGISDRW